MGLFNRNKESLQISAFTRQAALPRAPNLDKFRLEKNAVTVLVCIHAHMDGPQVLSVTDLKVSISSLQVY